MCRPVSRRSACWIFYLLLLRVFLLLVAASSALGQQGGAPPSTIVGQLRIPRSNFPPNLHVLVSLERSGTPVAREYCDSQGRFSFQDLSANLYHIVVNQEGFQPVSISLAVNPQVTHMILLTVDLIPEEKRGQGTQNGIQGSNPSLVDESALLENYPKKARKHYENATKFYADGKRDEAIREYQEALRISPEMYFARNNLGSAYVASQRFPEAEGEFRRVISENQADANAYFNLANVYLLTKRLDQARGLIDQGLSRQPMSAFGHFLMGSVMLTQGNHADAERYFRRALTEDPELANAHLALVNLYIRQNRSTDAANELSAFLKQSPDSTFAPQAREMLRKLQTQTPVQ